MHVPHSRAIRPHVGPTLLSTDRPTSPDGSAGPPPRAQSPRVPARCLATSILPTKFGDFVTHVFLEVRPDGSEREHVALVYGDVAGLDDVAIRVHSECITSEVFGSLKCDCKDQFDAAMREVVKRGRGVVLYLRQEGRDIGLANKIRAYNLQAQGHDTVDANRLLGLPDDARTYDVAADMIRALDIRSVELLTNNPEKVKGLRALGIEVRGRSAVVTPLNKHSIGYLETKRERMAHELPEYDDKFVPKSAKK